MVYCIKVTHVIKYEYQDGVKLKTPEVWCGRAIKYPVFVFQGAQHIALSVGGSIQPCKDCIKAFIKQLEQEL